MSTGDLKFMEVDGCLLSGPKKGPWQVRQEAGRGYINVQYTDEQLQLINVRWYLLAIYWYLLIISYIQILKCKPQAKFAAWQRITPLLQIRVKMCRSWECVAGSGLQMYHLGDPIFGCFVMGGMICNNFLLSDLRLGGLPAGGFHEDTRKVEAGAAGTGQQVGPLRLWRLWFVCY